MKIMRTPKSMTLELTTDCNLRCRYCSHFSTAGDVKNDLPAGEWFQFIEEMGDCAVLSVTITGGEPFHRQDLPNLIGAIVSNRMRFSILSNGTLLTEDLVAFIASTGRCNSVQVSIDGSCAEVHDRFRGRGSFDGAIRGLRLLQKHGIGTAVRVTIHRHNVEDLENVARFLLEDLGLPSFSTNSAGYMGLCRENAESVQLTVEERTIAMQKLLELTGRYDGRIGANAGPLAEARHWSDMAQARREKRDRLPTGGHLTGCGCPMKELTVRADGVIVPCSQMTHIELGRINRDSLQEIWQSHPRLLKLRARRKIPLSDFDYCRGCAYINYCTGNCPALAYTLLGEVDHPSPDACLRKFLQEGGRLPVEAQSVGS